MGSGLSTLPKPTFPAFQIFPAFKVVKMGLKQRNQCLAAILLVLLVSPSCLAFSLRNLISPVEKSSEVEGRQFSDDPIMNYAAWGFIAGLMDYFIRDAIAMSATTTTTTTTAATTAVTTTTTTAAS